MIRRDSKTGKFLKEKPYDHSKRTMFESCGYTEEEALILVSRHNLIERQNPSEVMETLENEFTQREAMFLIYTAFTQR